MPKILNVIECNRANTTCYAYLNIYECICVYIFFALNILVFDVCCGLENVKYSLCVYCVVLFGCLLKVVVYSKLFPYSVLFSFRAICYVCSKYSHFWFPVPGRHTRHHYLFLYISIYIICIYSLRTIKWIWMEIEDYI